VPRTTTAASRPTTTTSSTRSGGLNAVFSNGTGFPSTRWLFFGGARQEQPFQHYPPGRQLPSQVWYAAYPDLTAVNNENTARIRAGLRGELSSQEAAAWLRRI
jgi:hypothetical protein